MEHSWILHNYMELTTKPEKPIRRHYVGNYV